MRHDEQREQPRKGTKMRSTSPRQSGGLGQAREAGPASRFVVWVALRTLGSVVDFAGQDNAEGRAVAGPGSILKRAAVFFDDPSGNRQSEASTGFLRAKERVKKALFRFGRNACSGVARRLQPTAGMRLPRALPQPNLSATNV